MTRPKMTRPESYPLTVALLALLGKIDISATQNGSKLMPVGWGVAPNVAVPYLVLTKIGGRVGTGPIDDWQADVIDVYQITAIGSTSQMAERTLDTARPALTKSSIQTRFNAVVAASSGLHTSRHFLTIEITLGGQTIREERGLPNPVFQAYDQIAISHTPG